ncbi:MAG: peptidoglycan DD-metalloendopeptidase family protein [bacterium]|nr:peptidoglycan DD-metalloendopeptidase family protein [bacterium]
MFRLFVICLFVFSISLLSAHATSPEELKSAIEEKTKLLTEVNQKITQAQEELQEAQGTSKTLQKEITGIDGTVRQLDLGIRSSEITVDKLGLEIESLNYDIDSVRLKVISQKSGVAQLLREVQRKDNETTVIVLLKNRSLAESMAELQSVYSLNTKLSIKVEELQILDDELTSKRMLTSEKRGQKELENKNLKYRKNISLDEKSNKKNLLALTHNQEKQYQALITTLEEQQNSISDEIGEIEELLRASFDPTLLPEKRPGVLSWPVKLTKYGGKAYITQHFGEGSYLYRGKPHNGLDIGGLGVGAPIFAAADGTVVMVENNDQSAWKKYQYGKYVLIQHNNNLSTLYAHLSAQVAVKDQTIKQGDLIGYSGNTGYATGPHLHFGLYATPVLGWTTTISRDGAGFTSIPPAAGVVPVGVTLDPEDYL